MEEMKRQVYATVLSILLIVSIVGGVALLGATVSPVAADQHTYDEAPTLTDKADFTINLPNTKDHYPGDQNEANSSIEYFAAGDEAYKELGAEDGVWADTIIIDAPWIDYSACTTDNTASFGIDRGNNNSGVKYDEGLLEHRKDDNFRNDGLDVFFYNWEDFSNDPPYLAPEDAIVAAQGAGSDGGPCLTMTEEPGWYQIQGFLNGTIASGCTEEGNSECEPEDKEHVGLKLNTNYVYVCECDSRSEAEDELGQPPGGGPTPTATDPGNGESTPTATDPGNQGSTPTSTDPGTGGSTPTATDPGNREQNDGDTTPTLGDGPGFTGLAALLALLASALLANRRR